MWVASILWLLATTTSSATESDPQKKHLVTADPPKLQIHTSESNPESNQVVPVSPEGTLNSMKNGTLDAVCIACPVPLGKGVEIEPFFHRTSKGELTGKLLPVILDFCQCPTATFITYHNKSETAEALKEGQIWTILSPNTITEEDARNFRVSAPIMYTTILFMEKESVKATEWTSITVFDKKSLGFILATRALDFFLSKWEDVLGANEGDILVQRSRFARLAATRILEWAHAYTTTMYLSTFAGTQLSSLRPTVFTDATNGLREGRRILAFYEEDYDMDATELNKFVGSNRFKNTSSVWEAYEEACADPRVVLMIYPDQMRNVSKAGLCRMQRIFPRPTDSTAVQDINRALHGAAAFLVTSKQTRRATWEAFNQRLLKFAQDDQVVKWEEAVSRDDRRPKEKEAPAPFSLYNFIFPFGGAIGAGTVASILIFIEVAIFVCRTRRGAGARPPV